VNVLDILKLSRRGFERSSNSASKKGGFKRSSNSVIVEDEVLKDSQTQYSVKDEMLRDISNSVE